MRDISSCSGTGNPSESIAINDYDKSHFFINLTMGFLLNFCGTVSMWFLLDFCGTVSTNGVYRHPFLLQTDSCTSQLFVAFCFGTEEN